MRGLSWRLVAVGSALVVTMSVAFALPAASYPRGVSAHSVSSYANAAIADKALTYIGQWGGNACSDAKRSGLTGSQSSYPVAPKRDASGKAVTDGDGQCRSFVNCIVWMVSNHAQWLGGKPDGTYFGAFLKAGATEIKSVGDLQTGDVVQSGDGIHTTIIVKRVSGNVFDVVDSNHDFKETVLTYNRTVVLDASNRAFRLGSVGTASSSSDAPTNGRIAFASRRPSGHLRIYSINPDGSGLRNLTSDPGDDLFPDWSPDGKRIVYQHVRGTQPTTVSTIYVMNADGSGKRRLAGGLLLKAAFPSWSPDGRRIAFIGVKSAGSTGSSYNLYVMNSDGSRIIAVTHFAPLGASKNGLEVGYQPSWAPSGKSLAFTVERRGNINDANVYVVGVDGQTAIANLTRTNGNDDREPSWSSDGRRLLFSRREFGDNYSNIFVMNVDGANQTALTKRSTAEFPTWSPDGQEIAFARSTTIERLDSDIYVMNANGSNLRRLTRLSGAFPSWQPIRR